jgi:hypothetical protein
MLSKVAAAPKERKVELLRKYLTENVALRGYIVLALDPGVKWAFTPGWVPDYRPFSDGLDVESMMFNQFKYMAKFLENGPYPNMTEERRRTLFVQLLESVTPDDAAFLCLAKDKKLPYKLTKAMVVEAMPGLLPE